MKIAYYVNDSVQQLILTPENKHEKAMLEILERPSRIEVYKGTFYECQGGWVREGTTEESRIIVMRENIKG